MDQEPSIFTKIIRGELPCHKVYEDEHSLAFLNIYPSQPGHVLVVPKRQVDHLWDIPEDEYVDLMKTSRLVAQRLREVLRPRRVGVRVEGLEVPHAHIHLIPFNTADEFAKPATKEEPDHTALAEMAKRLAF